MKRGFLGLLLQISLLLEATQEQKEEGQRATIATDQAEYRDKEIILKGHSKVEYQLGSLEADYIHLTLLPNHKKLSFNLIDLKDNVHIHLKDGGHLSCSQATIDCCHASGVFQGNNQNQYVLYKEEKGARLKTALQVQSHQMTVLLAREGSAELERNALDRIIAEENVLIDFDQELTAKADFAVYQCNQNPSPSHDQLIPTVPPGLITLYSNDSEKFCQVTNRQGDQIFAKQIDIDVAKKKLSFTESRGTFRGIKNEAEVDFSADQLIYDATSGILTLRDGVRIQQGDLIKLQTEKEICLFQKMLNGQRSLASIEASGKTILIYDNAEDSLSHILTCHGPLCIDHQKLETHLSSPKEANGKVKEEEQIFFQDAKGEIYADRALIQYDFEANRIKPKKITLMGNVRIFNHLTSQEGSVSSVLQYVLTDQVHFLPQSKEMLFKAFPGKRVLFFDKTNNLEVSAPALKIIREQATKKETIRGFGDVRFSFVEHEFEQLRQRFSFDKVQEIDSHKQ